MSTPSDLMNLLHYARRQAVVDGREYYAAAVVLECGQDVPAGIRVYCPSEAWDSSVAGRLAARDAEIARLQDLLRRTPRPAPTLPAPADPTPVPAAPPITLHATWGGGLPRAKLPDEVTCPECDAAGVLPPTPCRSAGGLAVHRSKAHGWKSAETARRRTQRETRAARVESATEPFPCPCGATFPTRSERGGHQRWCQTYRTQAQAERAAAAAAPKPEPVITCRRCGEERPRAAFRTQKRASGGIHRIQPCADCLTAERATIAQRVHEPCPHCQATGLDGAPQWASLLQRNGHISACVRRAARPAKEPAVTAPKAAKAPKAPKPAQEAAPRPLPAPLPA